MEEELGLMGASAEDTEAELIRKICETELLAGNKNLLSFVLLLHIKLHSNPLLIKLISPKHLLHTFLSL